MCRCGSARKEVGRTGLLNWVHCVRGGGYDGARGIEGVDVNTDGRGSADWGVGNGARVTEAEEEEVQEEGSGGQCVDAADWRTCVCVCVSYWFTLL